MPDLTPEEWVDWLSRRHDAEIPELIALNDYYEGTQPLSYMHPELIAEVGDRLRQVVIAWPQLVVDAVEERLDVEGFRRDEDSEADDALWRIWQYNCLDEQSQQAHLDALIMRRAFAIVGTNADNPEFPLITVESPLQVYVDLDPRTRKVRAALKRWTDVTSSMAGTRRDQFETLYLTGATYRFQRSGGTRTLIDVDEHGVEESLVVPIVNRPRLMNPRSDLSGLTALARCVGPAGTSELAPIIPLSDAANKIATDMMVSAEFHAMPRRWALGFDETDFVDENNNQLSPWSVVAGRIWSSRKTRTEDGAEVGQFPEANLSNFHATLDSLAKLVASLGALPPHYVGFTSDNPASADAIRSNEARLVKRAERKQRAWGGSYEQVMRLAERVRDGVWNDASRSLETLWRDASTPTLAQKADAAVKLTDAGIIPAEYAQEMVGLSASARRRIKSMRDDATNRILSGDMAAVLTGPKPLVEPSVPPGPQG